MLGIFIVAIVVIILDQIVKYMVKTSMALQQSIPVIEDVFHITYIHNQGAAFGMLSDKTSLLALMTLIVVGVLIWYAMRMKSTSKVLRLSLALILGGSVGNLIDRVRFGYVVDYLDFRVWPVFNLADSALVVGAFILGYLVLTDETIFSVR